MSDLLNTYTTKLFTGQWNCRCNSLIERRNYYRTWTGTQWPTFEPTEIWRMYRNYRLTVYSTINAISPQITEVTYSTDRNNYGLIFHNAVGSPGNAIQGTLDYLTNIDAFEAPLEYAVDSLTHAVTIVQRCIIDNIHSGVRLQNVNVGRRRMEWWNEFTFDEFSALLSVDAASETVPAPRNVGTPPPDGAVQDVATVTDEPEIYWYGRDSDTANAASIQFHAVPGTPYGRIRKATAIVPGRHSYKVWPTPFSLFSNRTGSPLSCTNFEIECGGRYDIRSPMFTSAEFYAANGGLERYTDVYFDTVCPP